MAPIEAKQKFLLIPHSLTTLNIVLQFVLDWQPVGTCAQWPLSSRPVGATSSAQLMLRVGSDWICVAFDFGVVGFALRSWWALLGLLCISFECGWVGLVIMLELVGVALL